MRKRSEAIEDNKVIVRVLDGDREAFAILVNRYQTLVLGYCRGMLFENGLAEDAVQEIFLKAFRGLGKFQGKSSFSSWLFRIAANHCTDQIRARPQGQHMEWEELAEIEWAERQGMERNATEDREFLQLAMAELSEEQRSILLFREVSGLEYEELSQLFECTLDAVKGRLKRARIRLAEIMKQLLEIRSLRKKEKHAKTSYPR